MTDPYLRALDDVAGELRRLQQAGPEIPAYHRGYVLEQLGRLEGAIEELRRQRGRAPAEPALAEDRVEWDAAARW